MFLTVVFRVTVKAAMPYRDCLVTKETVSHANYCHQASFFAKHGIALREPDGGCFCCSIKQFALCSPSQSWESYCTQESFRSNVAFAPVCVPGREVLYRA